jgi:hypothetical protein
LIKELDFKLIIEVDDEDERLFKIALYDLDSAERMDFGMLDAKLKMPVFHAFLHALEKLNETVIDHIGEVFQEQDTPVETQRLSVRFEDIHVLIASVSDILTMSELETGIQRLCSCNEYAPEEFSIEQEGLIDFVVTHPLELEKPLEVKLPGRENRN